jgi:twitching motility protein PilT
MDLHELLTITLTRKASDLHLVVGYLPTLRMNGELHPLVTFSQLTETEVEKMLFSVLNPSQKELLISNKELDFSTYAEIDGQKIRFRGNAYFQRGTLAVSFRLIPVIIPSLDELNLPQIIREFTKLRQGFVLLTGSSGQGKSTTLASIIEEIAQTKVVNIVTIEDPIEYVFPKNKSIISQRELHQDTHSWTAALKSSLREDPDIVYIGEMRDYDTIFSALTIAETGHLVFSTLHTNSASQTIDRIIDIFPSNAQSQIRLQLSMLLSGVVVQKLVPNLTGGRVPVCEVLIGTASVKNTIREGKTHLIDNIIQTSGEEGMMLFEEHLKQLVTQNIISHEIALEYALRPDRYLQLIGR